MSPALFANLIPMWVAPALAAVVRPIGYEVVSRIAGNGWSIHGGDYKVRKGIDAIRIVKKGQDFEWPDMGLRDHIAAFARLPGLWWRIFRCRYIHRAHTNEVYRLSDWNAGLYRAKVCKCGELLAVDRLGD